MTDLSGRAYIVTGSTQGLGADIARGLVRAGALVCLTGLGDGEAVAQDLGDRAIFAAADLTQDAGLEACIATALKAFGRIDGLVNNACHYEDPGLAASREAWHRALDVNLVAPVLLAARLVPHLRPGQGVIVNIGSIGGKSGAADRMLYPASKAALLQITQNLAVTLAPRGIRVLSVSPSVTWSPSVEALAGSLQAADARGAQLHPLGRIGRGADVASVVAFALSDAAGFVTGTDIAVDGGYTALGPDQGYGPRPWISGEVKRD